MKTAAAIPTFLIRLSRPFDKGHLNKPAHQRDTMGIKS
jgi:hypothetical protein